MEDSYTVHRRRKAAARRREKTPDPPRQVDDNVDEEDARAKMEKMVEDTEKMADDLVKSSSKALISAEKNGDQQEQISKVTPSKVSPKKVSDELVSTSLLGSVRSTDHQISGADHAERVSFESTVNDFTAAPREERTSNVALDTSKNRASKDSDIRARDSAATPKTETSTTCKLTSGGEVLRIKTYDKSDVYQTDATTISESSQDAKITLPPSTERRSKKRSKEKLVEKHSYNTDSSDVEDKAKGKSLRRKKSPEVPKARSLQPRSRSRSRPATDTDEEPSLELKRREKRPTSKPRLNSIGKEDETSNYFDQAVLAKTESETRRRRYSNVDEESRHGTQEAKTRPREASGPKIGPNNDDDLGMKKSRTFPEKSIEKQMIKRSASEMKKQIIPLSDDSLVEDFAKAQEEYLRRERGILAPDPLDEMAPRRESMTMLRKRKLGIRHSDSEGISKSATVATTRAWFSWLPFFGTKEKQKQVSREELEPKTSIPIGKNNDDGTKKSIRSFDVDMQPQQKVSFLEFLRLLRQIIAEFKAFVEQNPRETRIMRRMRNICIAELILMIIYCGLGAFVFRFTEGAFETFYKCGVKRVKRDFLDSLWNFSHNMKEDDWKSMARRKLMEFEEQLHTAHEAGVRSYSGQRSWSFLNAVLYCLTVITTIGYGHIAPSTTTGRAITIVYAIFGIPMFLIILADFGKLFTRGMKFLWAFVRRLYYTGSCRSVRRTAPVQEVMKGVQLVYEFATFRRPSQMNPEDVEEIQKQQAQQQTLLNIDGNMPDSPGTPAMSTFAVDDEFNLPISVAIFILLGYVFIGAWMYKLSEGWEFFESFYFVFISMSTIGFGDYVPQDPVYLVASIVYLVFGLALTSMCINVVQVMLSDSFRQASQKISATIGFQVPDEDADVPTVTIKDTDIEDVTVDTSEYPARELVAPKAKPEDIE